MVSSMPLLRGALHPPTADGGPSEPGVKGLGSKTEGFYRLAAEFLPCGVLVVGPDGTMTANLQMSEVRLYATGAVGQSVDLLLPDAMREAPQRTAAAS
jgi:hypothetical protein